MDNKATTSMRLEEILRNEISVLQALYACQKRMYESVLVRDWVLLQKETSESETYATIFTRLEDERISSARALSPKAEGSRDFYAVTATLDADARSRANELFREMKRLLLLSKTENDVFNTYISNARAVITGMLETVLPGRKTKIYSRKGSIVSSNVESLVLNRSF